MKESAPTPARGRSSRSGLPRGGWLLIIPVAGGLLLLLAALGLMVFLGLRGGFFAGEDNPGMRVEVVKVTPAVSTSPLLPPSCETIISSGDVQVAVSLPISLAVTGETFPVVAIVPEVGKKIHPAGHPGAATWVCGTVVNYVVALEPVPENEGLLSGLRPGDEIKMHLANGVALLFRFVEQREAAANEAGVFDQIRPRLTLILEREDDTWQIATADYVAETEPVEPPSETQVQLGMPVRVGDAQVTAVKGYVKRGEPELPAGMMYYLLEFAVENVGTAPLDATAFTMQLEDGVGSVYLFSPIASAAGENGPLGGEIAPGATVQGTAGYMVPETLAGPTLTWTFRPWTGSESRASVGIPYESEAVPSPAGQSDVSISDAFLSREGDTLIIEGEVRNTGEEPVTVDLSDISLTSSGGMSDLRLAAPPLPWTVQPGQTQIIELQYSKPDASVALLTLLGYSFEIQGLR